MFSPAFSRAQEQIFANLQARLQANPWQACETSVKSANPYDTIEPHRTLRETAPMQVDSDYSEIFDKVVASFTGNVNIDRADQNVLADKVNYNSESATVDAQDNVYYREGELLLLGFGATELKYRRSAFA